MDERNYLNDWALMSKSTSTLLTGGAGFQFENSVQALAIVDLALGAYMRIFKTCRVERVAFQTERYGYHTDDMLLSGVDEVDHRPRRVLCQIKRGITFTQRNAEWEKCLKDFWADFNNVDCFNRTRDAFELSVARIGQADTSLQLAIEKIRNGNALTLTIKEHERVEIVRSIIDGIADTKVNDEQFNSFLCSIHIIEYRELDTWDSVSNDQRLRQNPSLWDESLLLAQSGDSKGVNYTYTTLPGRLIALAKGRNGEDPIMVLRNHSHMLMDDISSNIGSCHINRTRMIEELKDALSDKSIVFIEGDGGVGKSALAKDYLTTIENSAYIWLRAEDLNHPTIEECLRSVGVNISVQSLITRLSFEVGLTIVVDSLERLLQTNDVTCLRYLLRICSENRWRFIGILRGYSRDLLLYRCGMESNRFARIAVESFTEDEIKVLAEDEPSLRDFITKGHKYLAICDPHTMSSIKDAIDNGEAFDDVSDSANLRKRLWDFRVKRVSEGNREAARRRGETFEWICLERAKTLLYAVDCGKYESGVLQELADAGLIKEVQDCYYTVKHDKFEDMGVLNHLDSSFDSPDLQMDDRTFLKEIEDYSSLCPVFIKWIKERISSDSEFIEYVAKLYSDDSVSKQIKRCCVVAVFESNKLVTFLKSLNGLFAGDDSCPFIGAVNAVRLHAVVPTFVLGSVQELSWDHRLPVGFVPIGDVWKELFEFSCSHIGEMNSACQRTCAAAVKEWAGMFSSGSFQLQDLRATGLLALKLMERDRVSEPVGLGKTTLATAATNCYRGIRNEYRAAVLDTDNVETNNLARELREEAVFGMGAFSLAQDDPELLAELTRLTMYADMDDEHWYSKWDDEYLYGLASTRYEYGFAHGRKPPFYPLFLHKPTLAIKLCLEVCNHIGNAIKEKLDSLDNPTSFSLVVLQNTEMSSRSILCSTDFWCAYRGLGNMPKHIQSMLMSLENYLIRLAESSDKDDMCELNNAIQYILKTDTTVLSLAVIASLVMGYPDDLGAYSLPLFAVPEFYLMDRQRLVQEGTQDVPLPFDFVETMLYNVDRKPSNELPWRKKGLCDLCVDLQSCASLSNSVFKAIDSFDSQSPYASQLRLQVDTRICSSEELTDTGYTSAPSPSAGSDKSTAWQEFNDDVDTLFDWSNKVLKNGCIDNNEDIADMFEKVRRIVRYENGFCSLPVNLFCAAIVRMGDHRTRPRIMKWCQKRILRVCDLRSERNLQFGSVYIRSNRIDECLRALPMLIGDKSPSVRKRARALLKVSFLSEDRSIARPTAEGISLYLWSVDGDYAEELFSACQGNSAGLDQDARMAGVRWDSDTRSLLMLASPCDYETRLADTYTQVIEDAIAAERFERERRRNSKRALSNTTNDRKNGGTAELTARYLYETKNITSLSKVLKLGVTDAPKLITSVIVYLSALCDKNNGMPFRWEVVKELQPDLIRLSLKNPNDDRSKWAELIGKVLYRHAVWQQIDYERQTIRFGKECIMAIAKSACENVVVFESLAKLMYSYPGVFGIGCIHVLADAGEVRLREIFSRSTDAMFCLVECLRCFVLGLKGDTITREQYRDCLLVLDAAIDNGSRVAYFVRNSFTQRRWTLKRY